MVGHQNRFGRLDDSMRSLGRQGMVGHQNNALLAVDGA